MLTAPTHPLTSEKKKKKMEKKGKTALKRNMDDKSME